MSCINVNVPYACTCSDCHCDPGYIDFRQGDVALDCHVELRIKSRWGCILHIDVLCCSAHALTLTITRLLQE